MYKALHTHFKAAASRARSMAKAHRLMADGDDVDAAVKAFHETAATDREEYAEDCDKLCKSLESAIQTGSGDVPVGDLHPSPDTGNKITDADLVKTILGTAN